MKFEILPDDEDSNNEFLTRFLGLHKFISLLKQKTLFFVRLDLLQDPFEGITTTLIKQRYISRLTPSRSDLNPRLPEEVRESISLQKENVEKNYDIESVIKQKSQFVNCWFRGDRESMAMWNLYSNKESVAIKIEKKLLIDYLRNILELQPLLYPRYTLICGPVKYFKLNPVDLIEKVKNVKYSAFKKDVAFNFENEYRFLIATPKTYYEKNPPSIELNTTNTLFQNIQVICHPEMADWQYENIRNLCQEFTFINVMKSLIEIR